MPRKHQHLRRIAIALVAAAGVVPPVATARPTDRPDRYDSPTSSLAGTTAPRQDLRSPDARDAAAASLVEEQRATQAAARTVPAERSPVSVVHVDQQPSFDWADAAIGAGAGLALAAIAVGGIMAVPRRRGLAH